MGCGAKAVKQPLPTITLGRTGLVVTRLGVGGAYATSPDLYRAALECGVNYVDTARSYHGGEDERYIGQAIRGLRERLVIATKTLGRTADDAWRDLEASLRALGTDYIDIWQLHYLNTQAEREQVLGPGGAMEAALRAREEGLIRFVGVTGHVWSEVGKAVATGLFDTVLCWYNCAMREPEQEIFPAARSHGVGVVIMNATRSGKLLQGRGAPPAADFYRYVLSHPAVHLALMGLRDLALFRSVALALAERDVLSPVERHALEEYGQRLRAAGKLELTP
jgi:aryl-alcohol dehydrogenase-like predicted oxidoreductase